MSSLPAAGSLATSPHGSALIGGGGRDTARSKAKHQSSRSAIAALSTLPLLLLLIVGVVYSLLGARHEARCARHTDEVRVALLRLQSDLLDAETGQRGYVATGDPLFLEPYQRGAEGWRSVFDEIRTLAHHNPQQERRLDDLEPVIGRKLDEMRSGVQARRHGVSGATLVSLFSSGKETMDDIRGRIGTMLHEEEMLARERAASAARFSTFAFTGLFSAALLLVVGGAWLFTARRAEEIGRERQEHDAALVRDVIDNLPALAWTLLPDGRTEFFNRAWIEYAGTEVHGSDWAKAVDPEVLPKVLEVWDRCLTTGEPYETEFPLRGRDGVYRWFLSRARPLRDSEGRIERWVGSGMNIDEAKKYEREREVLLGREQSARQEAERAAKLAELFVAVLGHDLRNPLNAIKLSGSLLARSTDERSRQAATRITSSADRMARMIAQILDFSRIRSGQGLPRKPSAMDLRDVLSRVVQELTSTTGRARVRTEVQGDTHGRWDEDRLAQVFSNLIANALEHSPEGAPVRVSIDASDARRIAVDVQNPGVIPAELLPELFEPFRKAGQQAKSRGLGLGLYITKQIVEGHGGAIDVSTSDDAGTRFRVVLPREA